MKKYLFGHNMMKRKKEKDLVGQKIEIRKVWLLYGVRNARNAVLEAVLQLLWKLDFELLIH